MPADANIYSMIRPPAQAPGPLDQYAQAMTLKNLMGQQDLQGMQLAQGRRNMETQDQLRSLFARNPNPSATEIGAIDPAYAQKYRTGQLTNQKTEAEIKDKQLDAIKKTIETGREKIANINNDAALAAFREEIMRQSGPDAVRDMPASVADPRFKEWQLTHVQKASDIVERLKPLYSVQDFGGTKGIVQANPNAPGGVTGLQPKTMTPGESDTSKRGWASLNQPVWDSDRGAFIPRPQAGATRPASPAAAGAVSAPAAAPQGAIVPPGLPPSGKAFDKEDKLRNDYTANPMVKSSSELQNAFNLIETAYKRPSAANDLAMATKYMKILDPTSVVRESEFALAVNATGLLDKTRNYAAALLEGKKLNPAQRKDFYDSAKAINDAFQAERAKVDQQYADMAKGYGLNPQNVIPRLRTPETKPTEPTSPKPAIAGRGKFLGFE